MANKAAAKRVVRDILASGIRDVSC